MTPEIIEIANEVAAELSADVLFYSGLISQPNWHRTVTLVRGRKVKQKQALLILVTPGGDPDAAFKIGRYLQEKYPEGLYSYIPGWCKSAGTLLTLASKRIYIGDFGELGPLDIQVAKSDELYEMGSGLLIDAAMKTLEKAAQKMFINFLYGIRAQTRGAITTRTAAELSAGMVTKLLEPVYGQIDPMKIGENNRAMNITKNYGERLNFTSRILKGDRSLDFLVQAYPDHGFAIDRREAKDLFTDVREPTDTMVRLSDALGDRALLPKEDMRAEIVFLSDEWQPSTAATTTARAAHDQRSAKPNGKQRKPPEQPSGTA